MCGRLHWRDPDQIKAQVDKAVAQTVSSQFDATLAALQALQRQVEALSAKVDKLAEEKK